MIRILNEVHHTVVINLGGPNMNPTPGKVCQQHRYVKNYQELLENIKNCPDCQNDRDEDALNVLNDLLVIS